MNKKIGLITCEKIPQLTDSEKRLIPLLAEKGIEAEALVWTNPDLPWSEYQALIVRSIWDYYLNYPRYLSWLQFLHQLEVPVFNQIPTLLENSNKLYLEKFQAQGQQICPTIFLRKGTDFKIEYFPVLWSWEKVVLKPSVSASAHQTFVLDQEELRDMETQIQTWLQYEDYLIQKFLPEISENGEWSLIFFNARFSHAVQKRPKKGDFRVQEEYGGESLPQIPPSYLIREARNIIQLFAPDSLYARVDGLEIDEKFHLMELELIEPELFLHLHPQGHQNFVNAIMQRIEPRQSAPEPLRIG